MAGVRRASPADTFVVGPVTVDLSGARLVALARMIFETGESDTVLKKVLLDLVEEGLQR